MLFTSTSFLFYFLPATLALHRYTLFRESPGYQKLTRLCVLAGTLLFLCLSSPLAIFPFAACVGINFLCARLILSSAEESRRKLCLILSITANISLLLFLKRSSVFSGSLALGISFYTLEALSYVIDLYRREIAAPKDKLDFLSFIGMFPRFLAGPVVRFKEIETQLHDYKGMDIEEGLYLFCIGFFWKACFADSYAVFTQYAFAPREKIELIAAWLGVVSFSMQIYFELAGYSLMAIGIGRCLGFQFPTNFDKPYESSSFGEFWKRWNITVTNWFRDYVYFSLGGNQGTEARTYLNLAITMMVASLWYGTTYMTLLWGAWHTALLLLEKKFPEVKRTVPYPIGRTLTLIPILVGWVLFKSESYTQAEKILVAMFKPTADVAAFNPLALQTFPIATAFCVLGFFYLFFYEPKLKMRNLESIVKLNWGQRLLAMALFLVALLAVRSSYNY